MPEQNVGLVTVQPTVHVEVRPPSVREQFTDFYKENYRTVVKTVMAAGGTRQEAEDAVAESMRDLLTKWSGVDKPLPYVRTAAIRSLIKTRERDRKLREKLETTAPRRGARQPDDDLTTWEDADWVRQFLSTLPPTQRAVLALIYDEFSPKEIALLLGKNAGAIRQNLLAARQRGRETLASMATMDRRPSTPNDGPVQTKPAGEETR